MKPIAAVCAAAALTLGATDALAQTEDVRAPFAATTLQLSAYGEIEAPPDMATLVLGETTTGTNAAAAARSNAEVMARVVTALKTAEVAERDIQTSQLNLAPQYAYEPNQPPRLTGYQASNQVRVTVHDLTRLGRIADAVVGAGATNVSQIAFGLANPVAAENSARVAAVKALEDKAALYAEATGYRIGRLVNLSETGAEQPVSPMPMMALAARAEPATPIATGQIKVRVEVTGMFELLK
jgi:hypothetical protein